MNLNYSELCTVFIVTYYSQNKIKSCLDSIPRKYNVIIFDNSGQSDCKKEIENQILNTISVVIDSIISSYKGELDFAKPSKWKNGIPNCLSSVDTVSQNDQLILKHATEFSESLSKKNFNGTYSYLDPC